MTLQELESYYNDLLKSDIKAVPQKVKTFFDVADFPHYENVVSNFYAFYLNPNEYHGFSDMFLSSLMEIIKRKTNGNSVFSNHLNCSTIREDYTENGKYIDIVITEPSEDGEATENAVIIENKINAALYNDLLEYYNHVKVKGNKVGVVLSLKQENNLPKEFINITHKELINQIEQSSGSYFINADEKQSVILKEFLQNLKTMSHTINLKEHYEFYFKHQEKIQEISELYAALKQDIFKQVDDACEKLDMGLKLKSKSSNLLRYFNSNTAPVYFTIWLDDLFKEGKELDIYVELNDEGIEFLDEINKIKFSKEEKEYLDEMTKIRKYYIHYASSEGLYPSKEDIMDLTNYIVKQIAETPLKSIFLKIESCINEKTKRK